MSCSGGGRRLKNRPTAPWIAPASISQRVSRATRSRSLLNRERAMTKNSMLTSSLPTRRISSGGTAMVMAAATNAAHATPTKASRAMAGPSNASRWPPNSDPCQHRRERGDHQAVDERQLRPAEWDRHDPERQRRHHAHEQEHPGRGPPPHRRQHQAGGDRDGDDQRRRSRRQHADGKGSRTRKSERPHTPLAQRGTSSVLGQ